MKQRKVEAPLKVARGVRLMMRGRAKDALLEFCAHLVQQPRDPLALHYASVACFMMKEYERSVSFAHLSCKLNPNAGVFHNMGKALHCLGRYNDAAMAFMASLEIKPDLVNAVYCLAELQRYAGRLDLWAEALKTAEEMPHDDSDAVYERAFARLTMGDPRGWTDYRARWKNKGFAIDNTRTWMLTHREWLGEDITGKNLLIHREQGYGDCVQMMRYVLQTLERYKPAKIVVEMPKGLVELAAFNFREYPQITVCDKDGLNPNDFELHAPMLSLPANFNGDQFGDACPYLLAEKPEIRSVGTKHVGICWAGNKDQANDRNRSMPYDALQPLVVRLLRSGVHVHVLQQGERANDVVQHTLPPCDGLLHTYQFNTFNDTANVMSTLDCVVSVDTSVLHLAGALGVESIALLSTACDWRYGAAGDRMLAYPTVKLCRQEKLGEWHVAVAAAMRLLQQRGITLQDDQHTAATVAA